MPPMDSSQDLASNMPSIGMDYLTNVALFGNTAYMVVPSQTGEVSNTFGTVPLPPSLASILYMQQILAATNQANQVSSSTTGSQNLAGNIVASDGTGTARYIQSAGVSS